MTKEIETGGPAYPSLEAQMTGIDSDGIERWETAPSGGLTIRDYFAIHTLGGALTQRGFADELTFEEKAAWIYQMADAMIKARK